MLGWSRAIACVFFIFICSKLNAGEIKNGLEPGSIVLDADGSQVVYKDITGSQYGVDRILIDINGSPALLVLSKDSFYFTLVARGEEILIDCAYSDVRNTYNGARVTAGMCGLNVPLGEAYYEDAYKYSDKWRESIFSFDTRAVFEAGQGSDFLLGKIGEVEIFDRYTSKAALEDSSPQKVIKSPNGCFNFGASVGFLIFVNKDKPHLQYLDILQAEDPMMLRRLQEKDLKNLATNKCV